MQYAAKIDSQDATADFLFHGTWEVKEQYFSGSGLSPQLRTVLADCVKGSVQISKQSVCIG